MNRDLLYIIVNYRKLSFLLCWEFGNFRRLLLSLHGLSCVSFSVL